MEIIILFITGIMYFIKNDEINRILSMMGYLTIGLYYLEFSIDNIMILFITIMAIIYLLYFNDMKDRAHLTVINLFIYFSLNMFIFDSIRAKLFFLILAFLTFIRFLLFDIEFRKIVNFIIYNIFGMTLIFVGLFSKDYLLIFSVVGLGISALLFPLNFWYIKFIRRIDFNKIIFLNTFYLFIFGYSFIKLFEVYNFAKFNNIILILGIAGMVISSVLAIYQNNLKNILPYSTIAQMSYLFFLIGLNTEFAYILAYYHLISHGLIKFVIYISAKDNLEVKIEDLSSTGTKLLSLGIAIASIIGIPFFPGFVVKWNIGIMTLIEGRILLFSLMILVSIISIIYYMPVLVNSYVNEYKKDKCSIREKIILNLGSLIIIFLGFFSRYFYINLIGG